MQVAEQQVAELEEKQSMVEEEELTCSVCLEQVVDGELVRTLPCLHQVPYNYSCTVYPNAKVMGATAQYHILKLGPRIIFYLLEQAGGNNRIGIITRKHHEVSEIIFELEGTVHNININVDSMPARIDSSHILHNEP